MRTLSFDEIAKVVRTLLKKYGGEYALLFGSYAREEATADSDIDLIVVGGDRFKLTDILDFGEELRSATQKDADVFEMRELVKDTEFYNNVLREGIKIA